MAAAVIAALAGCAPQRAPFGATATPAPTSIPSVTSPPIVSPTPTPTPTPTGFNKSEHSITNPNSMWVVVNKLRPLDPKSYSPPDIVQVPVAHDNPAQMRKPASEALVKMFAAGKNAGAGAMQIQSSWRPYPTQIRVYNGWVARLGKAQADRQSARPGYSEHQTGLAVDISSLPAKCILQACFGSTPQGKWLASNAWRYGFLLRYPSDKEKVTGYEYEPWHFRYIGTDLSTEMHNERITTLEEFFGLSAAPNYAH